MASGRHWEWRAFGTLSKGYRDRFSTLPLKYGPPKPEWADDTDEYLWLPGCRINVKLRKGTQEGLKFKRLEKEEGGLQLWYENPEELYPYKKLDASVFQKLAVALDIVLPPVPPGPFDRESTLALLDKAKPRPIVVKVNKLRQSRILDVPGSKVIVEIAKISSVEVDHAETPSLRDILSTGLENDDKDKVGDASPVQMATDRAALVSAMDTLKVRNESLKVMSYLEALKVWAGGGQI